MAHFYTTFAIGTPTSSRSLLHGNLKARLFVVRHVFDRGQRIRQRGTYARQLLEQFSDEFGNDVGNDERRDGGGVGVVDVDGDTEGHSKINFKLGYNLEPRRQEFD